MAEIKIPAAKLLCTLAQSSFCRMGYNFKCKFFVTEQIGLRKNTPPYYHYAVETAGGECKSTRRYLFSFELI